jgi:hypothetical protein
MLKFSHEVTFQIGDEVYRKTDEDQSKCFVTGIIFRPSGVVYLVSSYGCEEEYYDFELSKEKTVAT